MKYVRVSGDVRGLNRLRSRIEHAQQTIEVGILEGRGSQVVGEHGETLATIGKLQEWGFVTRFPSSSYSVHVPARSWLNMPLHRPEFVSGARLVLTRYLNGQVSDAGRALGEYAVSWIRLAFLSSGFGSWSPLSAETIRRRRETGSSSRMPLIDTGKLMNSISWRTK